MTIDTSQVRSPGWWLERLFAVLVDQRRQRRLQLLHDYQSGWAPLPQGAENAREAFQAFQAKARSNFAELIVSAVSERMMPVGFRTAVDSDATGDAQVGALWERAGLDVTCADVHDLMLALSEAYVIVGAMDQEVGAPLITCEDPRWMVSICDPAYPRRILAALKVLHDDIDGEDRAYLYLPGQVMVAARPSTSSPANYNGLVLARNQRMDLPPPIVSFDAKSWSWVPDRGAVLTHGRIPVVRFRNKAGVGEYETHLDLLDRINHEILQRMVVSTMQAFRQRAVKGLPLVWPETHPLAGQEIDYNELFIAGPAAMWQLPDDAEMWESAATDLRPILEAVNDDLEHLASVTRTPMHMLSPGGENQSAEGASLSREGLIFKVEDRISRCGYPWAQVMSLALLHSDQPDRADLSKLRTLWAPVSRLSLAERSTAAAQLAQILPRRTLYINILGMAPDEADRAMSELTDEQILAAQVQAALAAANPAAAAGQSGAAGTPGQPAGSGLPKGLTPPQAGPLPVLPGVQFSTSAASALAAVTPSPRASSSASAGD